MDFCYNFCLYMNRPTLEQTYLEMCQVLAKRSHHQETKVGCIITSADNQEIYSAGYNGVEAGGSNKIDSDEPGESGTLHAEINCSIRCRAPRSEKKNVYLTHAPCVVCARALINLGGVRNIYFINDYRTNDGLILLFNHGIECHKLC